jgi:putative NIF3 family GTP cyclohydrolase 1 type 2
MSAMRDEIVQFLNDYLQVEKFKDYCPNGMQVIGRSGAWKSFTDAIRSRDILL